MTSREEQAVLEMYVQDQAENIVFGEPVQHFGQWAQQGIVNPAPLLDWYATEYRDYLGRKVIEHKKDLDRKAAEYQKYLASKDQS